MKGGDATMRILNIDSNPGTPILHTSNDMDNTRDRMICYDCLNQGIQRFFFHKRALVSHKLAVHGIDMGLFPCGEYTYHIERGKENRKRGFWVKIWETDTPETVITHEFLPGRFTEARSHALQIIKGLRAV